MFCFLFGVIAWVDTFHYDRLNFLDYNICCTVLKAVVKLWCTVFVIFHVCLKSGIKKIIGLFWTKALRFFFFLILEFQGLLRLVITNKKYCFIYLKTEVISKCYLYILMFILLVFYSKVKCSQHGITELPTVQTPDTTHVDRQAEIFKAL